MLQDVERDKMQILKTIFKGIDSNVSIVGTFSGFDGQFKYQLSVDELDTKIWAPYVFPFDGFEVTDDTISIIGTLISKNPLIELFEKMIYLQMCYNFS